MILVFVIIGILN